MINIVGYDAALQRFHVRTQYHPNCRTHGKAGLQLCLLYSVVFALLFLHLPEQQLCREALAGGVSITYTLWSYPGKWSTSR